MQFFFGLRQLASFVKNLLSALKNLCVKLSLFLFKLGCKLVALTFVCLLFFFERSFQLVIFLPKGFTLFIVLYYFMPLLGFVEAEGEVLNSPFVDGAFFCSAIVAPEKSGYCYYTKNYSIIQ